MIALAGPFYIMSWLPARYLGVKLTFPTDPKIVVGKVLNHVPRGTTRWFNPYIPTGYMTTGYTFNI